MHKDNDLLIEDIELSTDSEAIDGFTVLHFSDLHFTGPSARFDKFFDTLSRIKCDLAVISGDLIENDKGRDACVKYLSCLKPNYGTFITYGNHDRYSLGFKELVFFSVMKKFKTNNISLLESGLRKIGATILDNNSVRLCVNGKGVRLIGIESPLGYGRFNFAYCPKQEINRLRELMGNVSREDCNILISHVPDLIKELDTHKIDLILSSHTHGGQIRLPLLGPIFAWSSFQRKYSMGIFRYNNSVLQVSSGIGVSRITPFRFRCSPRASVIIFKKKMKGF